MVTSSLVASRERIRRQVSNSEISDTFFFKIHTQVVECPRNLAFGRFHIRWKISMRLGTLRQKIRMTLEDAEASARKAEAARKRAEDIAAGVVQMNGRELFLHEPSVFDNSLY
ncbi:uncharacterized protein LOC131329532 isoform X1 [Rhododendron vialii]|uniref:uncharacterized protein LOC131329532 isoform X1 n=1 Tax=Rhododendron vialii TaxID=182163 RepID=UPI00265F3F46|nr:uncharacterized protein LOC131329532 isoform X1 [Rhododendron vialii]